MTDEKLIFNVTDATFVDEVLSASESVPIAVDFWAPWCQPCRALSPVLERVVESLGGAVRLAKVDVDKNSVVAQRLGVTGVPTVKLFRNGQIVSEFVGVIPEVDIKTFLNKALPSTEDALVEDAIALMAADQVDSARAKLEQALETSPSHPGAHLEKGKLLLRSGDFEEAERELEEVSEGTAEFDEAVRHLAGIEFDRTCRRCGGLDAAEERHGQSPESLDAKFELGRCLAAEGDYRRAMDLFLSIVQADRNYRDGAAKDDMVRVFGILGHQSALAREYRSRLASALY